MRYEVYDYSADVCWGVFDDEDEACKLAEELNREDYTRDCTVIEISPEED